MVTAARSRAISANSGPAPAPPTQGRAQALSLPRGVPHRPAAVPRSPERPANAWPSRCWAVLTPPSFSRRSQPEQVALPPPPAAWPAPVTAHHGAGCTAQRPRPARRQVHSSEGGRAGCEPCAPINPGWPRSWPRFLAPKIRVTDGCPRAKPRTLPAHTGLCSPSPQRAEPRPGGQRARVSSGVMPAPGASCGLRSR